jgi:hypothetical protein
MGEHPVNYPQYERPRQFTDIPANPGFKARVRSKYFPADGDDGYEQVIAWRVFTGDDVPVLGVPIVAGLKGIRLLYLRPGYDGRSDDWFEIIGSGPS